jgi:hypothetical protein
MERNQALYLGLCAAIVAFALAFILPAVSPSPTFWYYPLERRWAFEFQPSGLAMDWFGRSLVATAAALVGFAIGYFLGRLRKRQMRRGFALWAAWAATAVAFAMALYTWQLVQRRPAPAPIPSWYVPK